MPFKNIMPNPFPATIFTPFLKMIVNTAPAIFIPEKLFHGQLPPLTARFQPIKYRHNHLIILYFCVLVDFPKVKIGTNLFFIILLLNNIVF